MLSEEIRADNFELCRAYIANEFGIDQVQIAGRDYDGETDFFTVRAHKYHDDAMATLAREGHPAAIAPSAAAAAAAAAI